MAAGDLDTFSLNKTYRFYLDTSALISAGLLAVKATGKPIKPLEEKRGTKLAKFAERAKKSQAFLFTTILAIEEIAAQSRSKQRELAAQAKQYSSWRDLQQRNPALAKTEDIGARQVALTFTNFVVSQMQALDVVIDQIDTTGGSSRVMAEALRQSWVAVFGSYALDPMDALHIVTGKAMGATHFVTFDNAWDAVSSIQTIR